MTATVNPSLLTADATRAEILMTIAGQPRRVRFGLKFLKAFTTAQGGADTPGAAMASLETAPIAALLDMLALAVRLSVPEQTAITSDDVMDIIDELAPSEQEHVFRVMIQSIKVNPITAALSSLSVA